MTIAGFTFQRINGLALEPSMFALRSYHFGFILYTLRKRLSLILLCSLLLTASTTAFIGIILYYCYAILKSNQLRNFFFIFTFGLLVILLFWDYVYAILDKTIFQNVYEN